MTDLRKLNQFSSCTRYDSNVEQEFMEFLLQVILELMHKMEGCFNKTKKEDEHATRPVLVIFLDNASGMNTSDWKFLELLQRTEHPCFQYLILVLGMEKHQ